MLIYASMKFRNKMKFRYGIQAHFIHCVVSGNLTLKLITKYQIYQCVFHSSIIT